METCKNCGAVVQGNYCSNCGQATPVKRISFQALLNEVAHFFTHLEKGFLFTTRNLLCCPGKSVRSFIDGSRKKYQTPVSYFLIWITIYFLFLYSFEKFYGENVVINFRSYFGPGATTQFAIRHLALVLAVVIPFQAMYYWLLVTRGTYNYAESVVVSIYSIGTIIVCQLLFSILALLTHLLTGISVDLQISDAFKILYMSWFAFDFTRSFALKRKLIRTILVVLLAFGTFTLWRFYGFPAAAKWLHLT